MMTPEQKKKHQEDVRNEGLIVAKAPKLENHIQVDLEIDEEGAANKFLEEGAPTI